MKKSEKESLRFLRLFPLFSNAEAAEHAVYDCFAHAVARKFIKTVERAFAENPDRVGGNSRAQRFHSFGEKLSRFPQTAALSLVSDKSR